MMEMPLEGLTQLNVETWQYWPWIPSSYTDPPSDENLFGAVATGQGSYDIIACYIHPESGDLLDASTGDNIGWDAADITYWQQVTALPPWHDNLPRQKT